MTERLYRFISGGAGVYEAVDQSCPRADVRRLNKPVGSWLPKIGTRYSGAISFWTRKGKQKYEQSGLRAWHESVCVHPVEIVLSEFPKEPLYQDEFQVICMPSQVSSLKVRQARKGDALGIANVHVQSWNETYSGIVPDAYLKSRREEDKAKEWEQAIVHSLGANDEKRLIVAEDDTGRIVGMNIGGPAREPGFNDSAELYALYLLRQHHRTGLGRLLFTELTFWFKQRGYSKMMLWVLEGNPTIEFYRSVGGRPLGAEKEVDFGTAKRKEIAIGWNL